MLKNLTIGRKLTLMLGACVLQLAFTAALAVWALQSVDRAGILASKQTFEMLLAQKLSKEMAKTTIAVGKMTLISSPAAEEASLAAVRKSYHDILEMLKSRVDT